MSVKLSTWHSLSLNRRCIRLMMISLLSSSLAPLSKMYDSTFSSILSMVYSVVSSFCFMMSFSDTRPSMLNFSEDCDCFFVSVCNSYIFLFNSFNIFMSLKDPFENELLVGKNFGKSIRLWNEILSSIVSPGSSKSCPKSAKL